MGILIRYVWASIFASSCGLSPMRAYRVGRTFKARREYILASPIIVYSDKYAL